jgi:EAL domain-containing protein (putative c-di-GMP-specific phosphodiesterase class I)
MIHIDEIASGLARNEFYLEYLPTVSLTSGTCVGAEALVRWRRPSGIVRPDQFIPIMEGTPFSGILTYWVIETVAAELHDWLRTNPQAHVSINVPPEILGRGGLVYAGEKSGLNEFARQVVLEITERGVPDQLGLQAMVRGHNIMGVRFALDDVTMSGANLALLTRCPYDIIKISREVVQEVCPEQPHPEWLNRLAALLRDSSLEVIAEGVETPYQADALNKAGIRFAQGYFFSQPVLANELITYHARTQYH